MSLFKRRAQTLIALFTLVALIFFLFGAVGTWFRETVGPYSEHGGALLNQQLMSGFELVGNQDEQDDNKVILRATMFYGPGLIKVKPQTAERNGTSDIEAALRTHAAYDRLHGYTSRVLGRNIMDSIWSKPAYLLQLVLEELAKPDNQRHQWLMWYDADTVIMNPLVPLEIFLPPEDVPNPPHLITTKDHHGLNNGVFFLRICPWSVRLLADVLAFPRYRPTTQLKYQDQSAMESVLKMEGNHEYYVLVPMRWFNGYTAPTQDQVKANDARTGSLLVHLAGSSQKRHFRKWLTLAMDEKSGWRVPLADTYYPAEVTHYWRNRRGWKRL